MDTPFLESPLFYSLITGAIAAYAFHLYAKKDTKKESSNTFPIGVFVIVSLLSWLIVYPDIASRIVPVKKIGHALSPTRFVADYVVEIGYDSKPSDYGVATVEVYNYYSTCGEVIDCDCAVRLLTLSRGSRTYELKRDTYEDCLYRPGVKVDDIQLTGLRYKYLRLTNKIH